MGNLLDYGERKLVKHIKERMAKHNQPLMLDDSAPIPLAPPNTQLWITTDPCPFPNLTSRLKMGNHYEIGWLCVVKSLSDLAAMGAKPLAVTVAVDFDPKTTIEDFDLFFEGVIDCTVKHNTALVGGNIKEAKPKKAKTDDGKDIQIVREHAVSTAVGYSSKDCWLPRGPVDEDSVLYVIEKKDLGGFWAGVAAHWPKPHTEISKEVLASLKEMTCRPTAKFRAAEILLETGATSFCMDNSDGLLASLLELLSVSKEGKEGEESKDRIDCVISLSESDFPEEVKQVSKKCRNLKNGYEADMRNWALGWGTCQLLCASHKEGFHRVEKALAAIDCEPVIIGETRKGQGRIFVADKEEEYLFDASAFIKCEQFLRDSFWTLGPELYAEAMLRFRLRELSGPLSVLKKRLHEWDKHGE